MINIQLNHIIFKMDGATMVIGVSVSEVKKINQIINYGKRQPGSKVTMKFQSLGPWGFADTYATLECTFSAVQVRGEMNIEFPKQQRD